MAAKESVLTPTQKDSLSIEEFIFHIIDPHRDDSNKIIELDEVVLSDKQRQFFLKRLQEMAEGTQYVFNDTAESLKQKSASLLEDPNEFVPLSKQITADFSRLHAGTMSAGLFVVSIVSIEHSAHQFCKLVFLVKLDHKATYSYRYEEKDGIRRAILDEVPNSLSENKSAVQKSALIDMSDTFAWDVLAFDRREPSLTDYFRRFLDVVERETPSELTRRVQRVVRKWARGLSREAIPENEDELSYSGRSQRYIEDHSTFDTNSFLDTVVRDNDPERKAALSDSLKHALAEAGIAGQQFVLRPDSLQKEKRHTYKTAEGVLLIYEGDRDTAGIEVKYFENGKARITIETNNLQIISSK
jgi:hypothetical protein